MIELFFDFLSPYSYLACAGARALGERVGHEVVPRPTLLAGILNALGTKGPAEVPPRRAYVIKDVLRAAARANLTITLPPTHPFNPLLALRVAGLDMTPTQRWRVTDALFAAAWTRGESIEDPAHVAEVLRREGLGGELGGDRLVALAATTEAKARLRATTEEALARGAFGVPTAFVDGEMFFGFDSFPAIEAHCRGEDPAARNADLIARWATLPASASRR